VAVLLGLVLDFLADDEDPHGVVCRLLDPLAAGSYVAISHLAGDLQPDRMALVADRLTGAMRAIRTGLTVRTHDDVTRFFDGAELVEPGVVRVSAWRAEPDDRCPDHVYGGLGRKSSVTTGTTTGPLVNTGRNRP
jgi:S-adenosyl methyltransferase